MTIINMVYGTGGGGGGGWQPGVNTLAYYNFNGNLNDGSGNNHPATVAIGSATYYTVNGDNKAITCSGNIMKSGIATSSILVGIRTLSFWVNATTLVSGGDYRVMGGLGTSSGIYHLNIGKGAGWGTGVCFWTNRSGSEIDNRRTWTYTFNANTWYNIIFVIASDRGTDCYINGVKVGSTLQLQVDGTGDFYIGGNYSLTDSSRITGYIDEFIVEDKARTAQEVSDYYDQTKGNYGL